MERANQCKFSGNRKTNRDGRTGMNTIEVGFLTTLLENQIEIVGSATKSQFRLLRCSRRLTGQVIRDKQVWSTITGAELGIPVIAILLPGRGNPLNQGTNRGGLGDKPRPFRVLEVSPRKNYIKLHLDVDTVYAVGLLW